MERLRSISGDLNQTNVGLLRELLEHTSSEVRFAAAGRVGEMGDESHAVLVHPLLQDRSPDVRFAAAEALGSIGGGGSHRHLIRSLADPSALVRMQAAESLGILRASSAIKPLVFLLNDPDELVRGYAAEALGDIGNRRAAKALRTRLQVEHRNASRVRILAGLYKLGDRGSLPKILRFLNIRSYHVRCAAAAILDEIAERSTSHDILEALRTRLRKESTVAARDSIERSIESISSRFPAAPVR